MSFALANAAPLKPDIRLAQAVSEFEAALSDEQKATFRSYGSQARASPPNAGDIARLTAEVDLRAARGGHRGRCFGPRFSNILETIQQFAALGDTVVGGSQNIIACGVWSLVRMTLLLVVNFHSYFDKLSTLLMAIGRSAPRYQIMTLLYPQSKKLQSYLCEYFIVVVRLCHQHLKLIQKSTFGQLMSFLGESDLKTYQSDCDLWASSIKEEVNALMAKDLAEQGSRTKVLLKFSKSESHHKKSEAYLRILNSCSAYDYQKAWKATRKVGYATLLNRTHEYQHWKVQPSSCTLVCTGKLGSGKSVLLANMVDDLNLHVQNERLPIAYFFCQHDNPESLQARTIMGCLARQLLGPFPGPVGLEDFTDATSPTMDLDGVTSLLLKVLPPKAYFVIDGLDECDNDQRQSLIDGLRQLQEASSLLVCISFRIEADTALRLRTGHFARPSVFQIPDDNPDVMGFITAELEMRIRSGELKIGEPTLILEIEGSLVQGAQGMFLWVALQIESLCTAKTDEAIRQALADLPKDLPSTFSRILRKSETLGKDYQRQTFKLVIAAQRPLTTDELREALSVKPGDTDWKPAQLLNDIYSALACCGSLVTVDEEDFTVRLVHHSVKQFLLGGFRSSSSGVFTLDSAMRTMGDVIVTYLNYGIFDNQLSTKVVPQVVAGTAPRKIIQSTLDPSSRVQELALRFLKSGKQSDYNVGKLLMDESKRFNQHHTDQFNFFPYAKLYWFHHIRCIPKEEPVIHGQILKILRRGVININVKDEDGSTPLQWAAENGHEAVVRLLLDRGADKDAKVGDGRTPLHWAAAGGHEAVARLLVEAGADKEAKDGCGGGRTPLHLAAAGGHEAVARLLVEAGADKEAKDGCGGGRTPLHRAAEGGHEAVARLLVEAGADKEAKDGDGFSGRTPLHRAAEGGHEAVARLLVEAGADKEAKDGCGGGRTPLHLAAEGGHEAVARLLVEAGADKEAKVGGGRTPLHWAAAGGHEAVARLLVEAGADKEAKDGDRFSGRTPLHWAAEGGHEAVARLLVEAGADKEAKDGRFSGRTPLHWAAEGGHEAVARLLVEAGADKEAKDGRFWRTPLHWAAVGGHEAVARLLVEAGADKEAKDGGFERTPLHWAAEGGHEAVARLLVEAGADKEAKDGDRFSGRTPLHWAAEGGHEAVARLLVEAGADKEAKDGRFERTPLHCAAVGGHEAVARLLVEAGADKEAKDDGFERTPLHLAAAGGHEAVARLLVEAGADKEAKDDGFWRTPLHCAAEGGHEAVAQLLVEAGADKEAKDGRFERTPLHCAAVGGHEAVARLLVEAGADKEAKDGGFERTPLHCAAEGGHEAVARLLVEAGADKEAKDGRFERTPLHCAAEGGHEAVARLLVEAGADKEAKDGRFERTPLHYAAEGGHEAVARLLVEAGADKEAKDGRFERTPLHCAAEGGHEAVARLLVEAGADKEAKDGRFERTPLHYAAEGGHEAVARLLVEAGADKEAKDGRFERTPLQLAAAKPRSAKHAAVARLLK
ncbi:hypothetical protein RB593_010240 [Gaeumannomyces tritici]